MTNDEGRNDEWCKGSPKFRIRDAEDYAGYFALELPHPSFVIGHSCFFIPPSPFFLERLDLIGHYRCAGLRPGVGGEPGLLGQFAHELPAIGELLPDLRQVGGFLAVHAQHHAVDAGPQLVQQVFREANSSGLGTVSTLTSISMSF